MLLDLINVGVKFLEANPILVGVVISVTEFFKRWMKKQAWAKDTYSLVFGMAAGFLFAIPSAGFEAIVPEIFIAQGVALGGVACGLYMTASSISKSK